MGQFLDYWENRITHCHVLANGNYRGRLGGRVLTTKEGVLDVKKKATMRESAQL